MAVRTHLGIDEFSHPIQALSLGAAVTLAFTTAASAPMAARIQAGVQVIRLVADQDCYIAMGPAGSVDAAVGGALLPAGIAEYFRVPAELDAGAGIKVAVRGKTAAGNLSIVECF